MAKRLSIHPKPGRSRAHASARPEPVINASATVRRQGQTEHARGPHKDARTQREPNLSGALPLVAVLSEIRLRLLVAMAASAVCSAALKAQHADSDDDVAVLLQRSIADELNRQIERLDAVIARKTP
jgi:hypothetical protein